jgi:hypothetical protein
MNHGDKITIDPHANVKYKFLATESEVRKILMPATEQDP